MNADNIKQNNDIVEIVGRFVTLKKEGADYKGCCPFHDEKTPSFNVNPSLQIFKCFGCDAKGDVIEFIMKHQGLEFKAAMEYLGAEPTQTKPKTQTKKTKPEKEKPTVVPLELSAARDHYTVDAITSVSSSLVKDKQFIKAWKYFNADGAVELVACRFESEDGKKTVLSYYWDGTTLRMKNYPVLLYNRHRLENEPEKDVLIVYGEKCAEIADQLGFIGVTWNGGEKKVHEVDFSPLMNRTVYQWPDDDQKHYTGKHEKAGELMPQKKQPGTITAEAVKKLIPHVITVDFIPELRTIEPDGADIAEAMEYFEGDIDQIVKHIYTNSKRQDPPKEKKQKNEPKSGDSADEKSFPFEILGIADDGKAYFIGANDRMFALNPTSITKTQLMNLVGVGWWRDAYGKDKESWENATSDIIHVSSITDFDPDRMRGRGAWREPDGGICYHDGKKTQGDVAENRIYLRRSINDIGINETPATIKQRKAIAKHAGELTFETWADCVRTLGWAALAPFAGALPWRSAGLLTAASGTGKTTIVNEVIKPLAQPIICSGGESTAAGIRQRIGVDSCAIVVEEAETDTQKKRQNRDDTFSLMRQSTSDDSPDVLKGTIDGKGLSFTLRSMFFFVAISPEIDCEADENRIFRVGLAKAQYSRKEWLEREQKLKDSLTDEICRGVRAFTWANLPAIITLAERVAVQAQLAAKVDNRTAFAESLLLAAFMAVFDDQVNPTDGYILDFVKMFYTSQKIESRRNENEEMLDLILDYIIRVGSDTYTIREMLTAVEKGYIGDDEENVRTFASHNARRHAGMNGVGLTKDGHIAIAKNHPQIMKILDKGKGYQIQLARHPRLIDKGMNVSLGSGNVKNCVVIAKEGSQ